MKDIYGHKIEALGLGQCGNEGEEMFRNLLLDLGEGEREWILVVSYSWPGVQSY